MDLRLKILGLLFQNSEDFISPSTPAGIMALIEGYKIDLEGKDVVVVGRSNIVGKPVAALVLIIMELLLFVIVTLKI